MTFRLKIAKSSSVVFKEISHIEECDTLDSSVISELDLGNFTCLCLGGLLSVHLQNAEMGSGGRYRYNRLC